MLYYFYNYKKINYLNEFGEFDRVTFLEMLNFLTKINKTQTEEYNFFNEKITLNDNEYTNNKNQSYFNKLLNFLIISIQTLI